MRSDLIDIPCYVHHQTEAAILISTDEAEKVWLPKSRVEYILEKSAPPCAGEVTVPRGLAEEKGLA